MEPCLTRREWLELYLLGRPDRLLYSTNKYIPRFKLENHIRELGLYNKIKEFITTGNVLLTKPRVYRDNSNPTIVLEINKIKELRDILIPLIYDKNNNNILLKSLKSNDFLWWLKLFLRVWFDFFCFSHKLKSIMI